VLLVLEPGLALVPVLELVQEPALVLEPERVLVLELELVPERVLALEPELALVWHSRQKLRHLPAQASMRLEIIF